MSKFDPEFRLFAALGGELGRQPTAVKNAATAGQSQGIELLSGLVPGRTMAVWRKRAIAVLAEMIGGMILAHSVSDPELFKEILSAVAAAVPGSGQKAAA